MYNPQIYLHIYFFIEVFFKKNKHTIFHYIKLKLQQKDINRKKRYIRLKFFFKKILNVKNQKNKTTKTKQAITKTPKEIHKVKKKKKKKKNIKKRPTPFF